jgi:hypothetical protein
MPLNSIHEQVIKWTNVDDLAFSILHRKFIQFQNKDVGLILSKLNKDEGRFSFGWTWDCGFCYFIINDYAYGIEDVYQHLKFTKRLLPLPDCLIEFFYAHYGNGDFWLEIENVFSIIAYSFAVLYPYSTFSNWYAEISEYTD